MTESQIFDQYLRELIHGEPRVKNPAEFRVMLTIVGYVVGDGCLPGFRVLARDCCLSERSVRRAIKGLRESGWMDKLPAGPWAA
jgi:hypothetical protein